MSNNIKRRKFILLTDFLIILFCVVSDRLLKIYALTNLKDHPNKAIIHGVLEFRYLENSGAAFGLLKGERSFFILVSAIMLVAIFYAIIKMPNKKKYYPANIFIAMFIGGTIGNLIDRILYSYVVDYIYFSIIKFPIFNLADFYITVASVLFFLFMLFYYKETDINFLKFKENMFREMDK